MTPALYKGQGYVKHLDRINFFGRENLIFKKILKYLEPKPRDRILEIGCNRGKTVRKIKKYSQNSIGIDINLEAVKNAVTSNVIEMDGVKIDFPQNYFDKIYSSHTIEHIPDLNKFIKEIERILKPGGRVLLVYPFELFRGSNTLTDAAFVYKDLSVARKLHLHRLTPNKIKQLIMGTSLEHRKSKIHFVPFLSYFTVLEKKNTGV